MIAFNSTYFYLIVCYVVSLAAVFLDVTQRSPSFGGALRDIQKTAARETIGYAHMKIFLLYMRNISFISINVIIIYYYYYYYYYYY